MTKQDFNRKIALLVWNQFQFTNMAKKISKEYHVSLDQLTDMINLQYGRLEKLNK